MTDRELLPKSQPQVSQAACHCGQLLPENAQFCYRCGAQIGEPLWRYRLTCVGPAEGCQSIAIDEELVIGKDPSCDLVIQADEYVSRRHARIYRLDSMFYLEDLASCNGTLLRVRRPIILEIGDEIVIGKMQLRLEENANNTDHRGADPCQR